MVSLKKHVKQIKEHQYLPVKYETDCLLACLLACLID
jgi:hypothetical protein